MDIKDKLTQQEKQAIENLRIEALVLQSLFTERQQIAEKLLGDTFIKLGINGKLYGLTFNFAKDMWEVALRQDVLALPNQQPVMNRQQRRHPKFLGG